MRLAWMMAGWLAVAAGAIGALLPLLPTVPFMILAAFCFARGNPKFEKWLLDHRYFGPHIHAWRQRGAISRRGKFGAIVMLSGSAIMGLIVLPLPYNLIPLMIAVISSCWLATRPS